MKFRSTCGALVGRISFFLLRHLLKRNASQLPGRVALAIAGSALLEDLCAKVQEGVVMVCGTNGKTTTNNLLAQSAKAAGKRVVCNYAGANMQAGIVTALLPLAKRHAKADWAVLEVDELSCARTVPFIKPRFFLLLNLFRDQLDRAGEIDYLQEVLAKSLAASPQTQLIFCADDPLCAGVAIRREALSSHAPSDAAEDAAERHASTVSDSSLPPITFGIGEAAEAVQDRVPEARFCQVCGAELAYEYRQFAQMGKYVCPRGDFTRPPLTFAAQDVEVTPGGVSFSVLDEGDRKATTLQVPFGGLYMVYNVLGVYAAAMCMGLSAAEVEKAIAHYHPQNGRLQKFRIGAQDVVLNLAKNPTGFNQNISLMLADTRPKTALFAINDNYNDGKDISWIWDVDFERLAGEDIGLYAGGTRAEEVAMRLKYAGFPQVKIAKTAKACLHHAAAQKTTKRDAGVAAYRDAKDGACSDGGNSASVQANPECPLYVLTNYSALWPLKAELEDLEVACNTTKGSARP